MEEHIRAFQLLLLSNTQSAKITEYLSIALPSILSGHDRQITSAELQVLCADPEKNKSALLDLLNSAYPCKTLVLSCSDYGFIIVKDITSDLKVVIGSPFPEEEYVDLPLFISSRLIITMDGSEIRANIFSEQDSKFYYLVADYQKIAYGQVFRTEDNIEVKIVYCDATRCKVCLDQNEYFWIISERETDLSKYFKISYNKGWRITRLQKELWMRINDTQEIPINDKVKIKIIDNDSRINAVFSIDIIN